MSLVMFRGKMLCRNAFARCFRNSAIRASSGWAADRVILRFPEFTMTDTDSTEPILFTGEMVSALARCFTLELTLGCDGWKLTQVSH